MKKITYLLFICVLALSNSSFSQTLTFSSDGGSLWNDGIASDGEGGSVDIAGLTIEIFNVDDALNNIGQMEWYADIDLGTANGFSGLTTFFAPSMDDNWKGQIIRESSGLEFQINGFGWYDWGNNNSQQMEVLGFRDNSQVASATFTGNPDGNSVSVSLDSSFDNVDEVRIITAPGTGLTYPTLNNIEFGSAVLSNEEFTYEDSQNIYVVNNHFISDNSNVLIEVYNILGQKLENENLPSGMYIVRVTSGNDKPLLLKKLLQ